MIATRTIGRYAPTSPTGPPPALSAILSPRQCQVALLIADHFLTNKQVAAQLGISHESVRTYVDRIARKLGVDRSRDIRAQIVRKVVDAWDAMESAA